MREEGGSEREMDEREKGGGGEEEEKEEFPGLKLKRGVLVGKSRERVGGVCTPPPTWTFRPHSQPDPHHSNGSILSSSSSVTARQLGANLWEISPHLPSLARMSHPHHRKTLKNKGFQMQPVLEDPSDCASDEQQPVSTGTFHRQIATSVMRHHRSVERNGHALQPVSPASYGSSMEITPYNPPASPSSSSLEYTGRIGDSSCSLKTSTELLKVLNRIWCLEEQHASNASRVKSLKMELDDGRTRIKELLREKQVDRQVIDDLMKQVSTLKHVKKNMDQDRVHAALQSVREELEDERKLRKRSESLHRKLAREISEIKSSFSTVLGDLERERRAGILLEDLCDEFAIGIRDYEQELRSLNYRAEKEQVHSHRDHVDSLVLHISEAWLDERVQMKLAEEIRKDVGEKGTIVDKLRPEIECFLKARQNLDLISRNNVEFSTKNSKGSGLRRQSLESFPLNEATSAPQNVDDDDDDGDSIDSDSNCFEINKNLGGEHEHPNMHKERNHEGLVKMDTEKRKGESREPSDGRSLSTLQARFEKHIAKTQKEDISTSHMSGKQEDITEEGILERRSKRYGNQRGNTNHMNMIDNLLRNNSSSVEGERIYPESELPDDSHGHFLLKSPVKKWEPKLISQDSEIFESSSRWPRGSKETSLKARLLEARMEGRNSQPKGSKGSA